MNHELLRFYSGKIIIFDLETESLNLQSSRPWQAGYIIVDNKKIIESNILYPLWKDLNVSEDAARITGFDKDKYLSIASDAKKCLLEMDKYIYDPSFRVMFYNGLSFDIYQHANWQKSVGFKQDFSYLERCIDVHCLYKSIVFNVKTDKDNFLKWQMKLCSLYKRGVKTNLSAACKNLGIEVDNSKTHNALYDIELTLKLFDKIKYQLDI